MRAVAVAWHNTAESELSNTNCCCIILCCWAGLRTLNLRQNILKDASELNSAEFKSTLVDLELRDNQLKEVRQLNVQCNYTQQ
jgi:hypothetical protein